MFSGLMARTAVLTVTVYCTNRVGVWGNTEETDRLYQRISTSMEPVGGALRKLMPFEMPALPENFGQATRQFYNDGVKGTFQLMHELPKRTGWLLDATKKSIMDLATKKALKKTIDECAEGSTSEEEAASAPATGGTLNAIATASTETGATTINAPGALVPKKDK